METNYDKLIKERAEHVMSVMSKRVGAYEVTRIRQAFEFARHAHAGQKRKTGEPYILHPIAVATIAAEELMLDTNLVIAAFLHDVVEDTDYTIEDITRLFGDDVAFLVKVVTKQKKSRYNESKQVDNYRQMLDSIQRDIRPLLVKLADRLHNMRTLSSMRPDKQMKIAGETDYFYAPLANRLGFYNVKTELENLSFRFRCPHDYDELATLIKRDEEAQHDRLKHFADQLKQTIEAEGIDVEVRVEYREPYSVWRKMHKYGDDFNHLKYRHFTTIIFDSTDGRSEKDMALRIYSILTNRFKEKPGGISNYIDAPKENGYQSFHVKLLADFGRWQEVHISSRRMVIDSQLGCVAQRTDNSIQRWIDKFKNVIRELADRHDGTSFIENVVKSFYNDDIMTFTPTGRSVVLPQKSTVLDFAYEVMPELAEKAKYARINGFLSSIKAPLRRGDVVEIFSDPDTHPNPDWLDSVVTYKAKTAIGNYLASQPVSSYARCCECHPIPGEEVIGIEDEATGEITVHKRDCPTAIRLASQKGDSIVTVDYLPDHTLYPVKIMVKAVDRYHLLIDIVDCITNELHLAMSHISTSSVDSIVTCEIDFSVHSYDEIRMIIKHISAIPDVDEVKRID